MIKSPPQAPTLEFKGFTEESEVHHFPLFSLRDFFRRFEPGALALTAADAGRGWENVARAFVVLIVSAQVL